MSLSPAQAELIDFILEDLIEFSADATTLKKQIADLKQALTGHATPGSTFYQVGKCFRDPQQCFQGLEKRGEVTVAEVQAYIIEYLNVAIYKATNTANLTLSSNEWNAEALMSEYIRDKKEKFKSVNVTIDYPDPNRTPSYYPQGAIYHYTQSTNFIPGEYYLIGDDREDKYISELIISANLGNGKTITLSATVTQTAIENEDDSDDDSDDDDAIETRSREALDKACQIEAAKKVAVSALKYLQRKKIITLLNLIETGLYTGSDYTVKPAEARIMTNSYYFDLLERKQLALSEIVNLEEAAAEKLCHPSVISCLQQNIFSIKEAKRLGNGAFRVLCTPGFINLITQGDLTTAELFRINSTQAFMLTYPPIAKLVLQKKMPLSVAKKLPNYATKFFATPAYIQHCENTPHINWEMFIKCNQAHYQLLMTKPVIKAISSEEISLAYVMSIPATALTILLQDARLANWLCHGLVTTHDIIIQPKGNMLPLVADVFARRLNKIRKGVPASIDGQEDNIESLLKEIQAAGNTAFLNNRILSTLLTTITQDVQIQAAITPEVYNPLLTILSAIGDPSPDWKDILAQLIAKADEITEVEYDPVTFFRPAKRQKPDDEEQRLKVREFCVDLMRIAPLNEYVNRDAMEIDAGNSVSAAIGAVFDTVGMVVSAAAKLR